MADESNASNVVIRFQEWLEWVPVSDNIDVPGLGKLHACSGYSVTKAGKQEKLIDVNLQCLSPQPMEFMKSVDGDGNQQLYAMFSFRATFASPINDADADRAMKSQRPNLNDKRNDLVIAKTMPPAPRKARRDP